MATLQTQGTKAQDIPDKRDFIVFFIKKNLNPAFDAVRRNVGGVCVFLPFGSGVR